MAMENTATPTALVLSRQNVNDLPAEGSRYNAALQAEQGAYIVARNSATPDVVLIASGSEVSTLIDASILLKERKGMSEIMSILILVLIAIVIGGIMLGLFGDTIKEVWETVKTRIMDLFNYT